MSARDAEYTEYVAARLSSLRRLAAVLCDDWQRARWARVPIARPVRLGPG